MSLRQLQTPWVTDVVTTTDATPTIASNATYAPPSGTAGVAEVAISFRNTSNNAEGAAHWRQAFKNVSGTVTIFTPQLTDYGLINNISGSPAVALVLSGTTIQPQVTGIAATNLEWFVDARYDVA